MARGNTTAQNASSTAATQAGTDYGNANALYGPLSTTLENQVANPQGINPTDMAKMDTAALQSGGGATAGGVGQGALRAARTRNAGGSDAATASSVRTGGEIASKGILANQNKNAELKSSQQQSAENGLNSLFSENLSGGNSALGETAANANANTSAENASWDWATDLLNPLLGDASKAKAFAG